MKRKTASPGSQISLLFLCPATMVSCKTRQPSAPRHAERKPGGALRKRKWRRQRGRKPPRETRPRGRLRGPLLAEMVAARPPRAPKRPREQEEALFLEHRDRALPF